MPRPLRFIVPGIPHHVTQRGNYRQQVFFSDSDYALYHRLLRTYSQQFDVAVQAYCLMPNHVHLIVTPPESGALPKLLQRLHADYARIIHSQHQRVGHLWQSRYFSAPMDERYFWNAMLYVEQNPRRAEMVERPWHWRWSSANAHLHGSDEGFLDLTAWRRNFTSASWKTHLELGLQEATLLRRIRESAGTGWPLGSEAFLDQLQQQLGRLTRPRPPGPKVKEIGSYGV